MNACIRAVTRQAIAMGMDVLGVRHGFDGLIDGDLEPLTSRGVSGMMQNGGTVLMTARSARFHDPAFRDAAVRVIRANAIDGVVIIGGNGSFQGAAALAGLGVPVIGIPASIDNDMGGTDMAIGVDTCLNTILDSVDKIKDTAGSLHRPFIIEVMGRHCGYLALQAGLAGGAEMVVTPESPVTLEQIGRAVASAYERGKAMFIVIVSEGAAVRAAEIHAYLKTRHPDGVGGPRLTILGHVQRGGSPSAFDRILATRLGAAAVRALADGKNADMVGLCDGHVRLSPLAESIQHLPVPAPDLHTIAATLAE
jgi:6-phosphofructokinase 1